MMGVAIGTGMPIERYKCVTVGQTYLKASFRLLTVPVDARTMIDLVIHCPITALPRSVGGRATLSKHGFRNRLCRTEF